MKILLAVSGGIDSMYMANKASELFPGASFAVAHCNFSLREDESDGDELFVREWCDEKNIKLYVKRFQTHDYATAKGISIEMAARELRYSWFSELCSEFSFDAVAVAHNANDNAETLILNLLRGTGSKGLRGMSCISGENPVIVRPLLGTTREDIERWMIRNGKKWREDRTNADNDYKRNRIRNRIFPIFKQINPSFIRTLNRDMAHFSQVDDIADDYFRKAGLNLEKGVDVRELLKLEHWEYVLFRLVEPYGFSHETYDKLVELLHSDRTISGKTFQSPSHVISIKKKIISITPQGTFSSRK